MPGDELSVWLVQLPEKVPSACATRYWILLVGPVQVTLIVRSPLGQLVWLFVALTIAGPQAVVVVGTRT